MNKLTITVALSGCALASDEYKQSDEVMAIEGFKRRANSPLPWKPLNLLTHPANEPHATYDGVFEGEFSALKIRIQDRIRQRTNQECIVVAFDQDDSAILL